MHNQTIVVVLRKIIGNNLAECFRKKTFVYVFYRTVNIFFLGRYTTKCIPVIFWFHITLIMTTKLQFKSMLRKRKFYCFLKKNGMTDCALHISYRCKVIHHKI